MASLIQQSGGRKAIQFGDRERKRRTVYLGKMTKGDALVVKARIERLNACRIAGQSPDAETLRWLSDIGDVLRDKLAAVGLVDRKAQPRAVLTLGAWLSEYIDSRTDLKPRSIDIMRRTEGGLLRYFGADKPLSEITRGDVKRWYRWLRQHGSVKGEPLARNTANTYAKRAKLMFAGAIEDRRLKRNPFRALKRLTVRADKSRQAFVTASDIHKVIEHAGDREFGLLIALCRFAGLRNPSETLLLRWENVDLPGGRMTVSSPKTAHHEGKEWRVVPITADLRPYLERAWAAAPDGAEWVLPTWRSNSKNLRTRMMRAIRRAGLKPWPRVFHNLRASCQTDLEQQFPSYVVCEWLGNSERVARAHYLQVTDDHFRRAGEALQKALQQVTERTETDGTDGNVTEHDPQYFPSIPAVRDDASPFPSKRHSRQGSNLQPPA